MQNTLLIYDGSFDGFLCAVFYVYEYNVVTPKIIKASQYQEQLFSNTETIITDKEKANRVWNSLKIKCGKRGVAQLYYAFLSELYNVENTLLEVIKYAFKSTTSIMKDYANMYVLEMSKITKKVSREKHRMEAFVRFRLTKDEVYFANIEPDFNVLPLIETHFRKRYADQQWIIYDLKRNYGLYYNLNTVEIVVLELSKNITTNTTSEFFTDTELEFQQLWKDYFKSTNIESRKNLKLHNQHVPKRYWKYLSEKQPF
ncbi:TIGR03915 family putative DNA repair protein [Olleya sp. YS]|uniref:TIGR03915 family putative DNA repair protein n=1 Tax=Olleya sp. YS TaxID=3028318 RepID=UPI0024342D03|nr:TIGR03915 family putative DNA repair protein [Olleya sp. YS]WGD34082.1 TIGR03915 family putative DNA repair protein [Olleya sp. YS]